MPAKAARRKSTTARRNRRHSLALRKTAADTKPLLKAAGHGAELPPRPNQQSAQKIITVSQTDPQQRQQELIDQPEIDSAKLRREPRPKRLGFRSSGFGSCLKLYRTEMPREYSPPSYDPPPADRYQHGSHAQFANLSVRSRFYKSNKYEWITTEKVSG